MDFSSDSTQRTDRTLVWLALGLLVLPPFAVFVPALFQGALPYGHDVAALFLPLRTEIARSLAAHEWPLWMPGILGGLPGIASCNTDFFYPTDLLAYLAHWSPQVELGLDAALHLALAGLGMLLLLRRLGRSTGAALLGAVFFAWSGSEASQVYGGFYNFVQSVALLPWIFWAAHKGSCEGSWAAWGLCGLAFSLQVLSGGAQIAAYSAPAALAFCLSAAAWERRAAAPGALGRARILAGFALAVGLAFLLSAPQLWLTLQYLPLAARPDLDHAAFIRGSIRLGDCLTWLVPGCDGWKEPTYHGAVVDTFTSEYFGLLPWALTCGALAACWRREAPVRFMAGLALVALFLAQGQWTPFYGLFQRLPVVSGFRTWSRILFLLTFAVCVLAARGFDALRDARTRAAAARGAALVVLLALAAAVWVHAGAGARALADAAAMPWLTGAEGGLARAALTLAGLAQDSAVSAAFLALLLALLLWLAARGAAVLPLLALCLAFHAADQGSALAHYIRFTTPEAVVDQDRFSTPPPRPAGLEPWRVFDADRSSPDKDLLLGYENVYGDESVPPRSFTGIMHALLQTPAGQKRFLDLFNVRYVFVHSRGEASQPGDTVRVLRNPGAYPRAWLVQRSRVLPRDADAWTQLAEPGFDPRREVILAAALSGAAGSGQIYGTALSPVPSPVPSLALRPVPSLALDQEGSVQWLARTPGSATLQVGIAREGFLVLSQAWHPSWTARIDGRQAEVLKADGGLQALALSPGDHQVEFAFGSGLLDLALAAAIAGLALLAGLLWLELD